MSKSILLVEDSHDAVELSKEALKGCVSQELLDVAYDGAEAIEYLSATGKYADRSLSDMPDLVILDLRLPKKNGFEVLEWCRKNPRTRRIPVIIMTVSNLPADIMKAYDLGANSYLRKPGDFEEYTNLLKKTCEYWLYINTKNG
ncbi:MAG: hypothetical protein A2054_10480 [Deltaproteobacteria bacterium GWA2_55_10]|nr:MAG: hypothetical protein A2054_10480 [Deltaproteobacteria bacterium GWA2_55_10]